MDESSWPNESLSFNPHQLSLSLGQGLTLRCRKFCATISPSSLCIQCIPCPIIYTENESSFLMSRRRQDLNQPCSLGTRLDMNLVICCYLNNRVFLSRNYRLIVALDVLKTNICPRSEASRANMLVLRTSNFQGATIRPIVPRHKHSIVFIVHY